MTQESITDTGTEIVIEELYRLFGYDFRNYARASFKRRLNRLITLDKLGSHLALLQKLRTDPSYLQRFVDEVTVSVTEMFRDPYFYATIINEVLPALTPKPLIRIWHAGCSTGEEIYSMAILLEEANLLNRSLLYATDLSPQALSKAREAVFPVSQMKLYSENYLKAGGKKDFSSYYTANYGFAKFDERLKKNMVISSHNLVSDRSFNEFQLIICRNVLIYFDKELQDRTLNLFDASLEKLGFLALGSKENIKFSPVYNHYRDWDRKARIWRKIA
ncbi:MAG: protein-glutamate O-methyltransferase CheR [Ferruginibacter sp.]